MRDWIHHNQEDMEEMLEMIMDLTLQILNIDVCHLYINDDQHQGLTLVNTAVDIVTNRINLELKTRIELAETVFRSKKPLIVGNVHLQDSSSAPKNSDHTNNTLVVPLVWRNKVCGAVICSTVNSNRCFNENDIQIAAGCASLCMFAIMITKTQNIVQTSLKALNCMLEQEVLERTAEIAEQIAGVKAGSFCDFEVVSDTNTELLLNRLMELRIARKVIFETKQIRSEVHVSDNLTPRELEVIIEITKGLSNKEIADKLYLSVNTIKFHVSSILSKLHLKDRTQAAL
jgi:DNA-binding CsgD family transcriptional regulator/transcriptional regulator with GAF, ATPase, and Fis domain